MPKIISASSYGFRTAIKVVMNPDDPEAVHEDGTPHSGQPPTGTDPNLRSWEWCHDCRYNWQVREFVWTGDELYTRQEDGSRVVKTNDELVAEIESRLQPAPAASEISGLLNLNLNV